MPQFRESDMAKFDSEYIFTPLYGRTQRDTDYEGEEFDWRPINAIDGNSVSELGSLGSIAKALFTETCDELGEDPEDGFVDFCEFMDAQEYIGNVGPAALKQAEGANAVMSCGYTGYMPTGKGRPIGMEIAGVVTKINPDPVNIHISCID